MPNSKQRLKSVSRSMYLSFAVLPRPLRGPMGVAYLLCRAADTIADGTAQPVQERQKVLRRYNQLFDAFPFQIEPASEFASDVRGVAFTAVPQDQRLMDDLSSCFQWLTHCSLTEQVLIGKVVQGVIKGMELDLATFDEETSMPRALNSSQDLENYLLWIGGEPGRFWSEMTLACLPTLRVRDRQRWIQNGIVFGTGLQLVNILRDLPADLKKGRCYIPTDLLLKHTLRLDDITPAAGAIPHLIEDNFRTLYIDVIEQARVRLMRGLDYLADIPGASWGLRAAVAWPMLIGLETLQRLQVAPSILNSTERIKMKRWEIYRLLATTVPMIPFQRWIERAARAIN